MKNFCLLLLFFPLLSQAQAPVLNEQEPMRLSEHINSRSFILDYYIQEDSTCDLMLETSDSTDIYFLQKKFIHKGQYELSIPAKHFSTDTCYLKLSCSYGMAEIRHILTTD